MLTVIGHIVTTIGVIFLFLGGLGILRFPDVYNRLQAGTKATTLGSFFTIVGVGIIHPQWIFKTIIIAFFILLASPISSHALGRGSYKSGVKLWGKSVTDHYKEVSEHGGIEDE
ncbi:MAG: Na+/H+ antiporter subunit G [Calditrichaeota bacterium]|nr:Na+/H+ antiporter subunit G [Calditrichota bacterium]